MSGIIRAAVRGTQGHREPERDKNATCDRLKIHAREGARSTAAAAFEHLASGTCCGAVGRSYFGPPGSALLDNPPGAPGFPSCSSSSSRRPPCQSRRAQRVCSRASWLPRSGLGASPRQPRWARLPVAAPSPSRRWLRESGCARRAGRGAAPCASQRKRTRASDGGRQREPTAKRSSASM